MEWMYNRSGKSDSEEYLPGKPIDRGPFEEPSLDYFMRSIRTESLPSQVELTRKLREDPLAMLLEKELKKIIELLLWEKSQMRSSDPDVKAVQTADLDQADTDSKSTSIQQLIWENMREILQFNADFEESCARLNKKKEKLRGKRYDSSRVNLYSRQVSRSSHKFTRSSCERHV